MVVAAMLLSGSAMGLSRSFVMFGGLGVRILRHFESFCLAGMSGADMKGVKSVRTEHQWWLNKERDDTEPIDASSTSGTTRLGRRRIAF